MSSSHRAHMEGTAEDGMEIPITLFAPATCVIRVQGTLAPNWSADMHGMAITIDRSGSAPITELEGRLADQAALHGVLAALYELGMPLLLVECAGAQ